MKKRNTNPAAKNEAHGQALEDYRYAEARPREHENQTNNVEGRNARSRDSSTFDGLVADRDQARGAVAATEKPAPKTTKKAKK